MKIDACNFRLHGKHYLYIYLTIHYQFAGMVFATLYHTYSSDIDYSK